MSQIYISYEWGIKRLVREIVNNLREKTNHKIWIDQENVIPGEHLLERIRDGIDNSEIIIAFVNGDYLNSRNCLSEIQYAKSIKKKILYIGLENPKKHDVGPLPFDMRILLVEKVWLNAYNPEWNEKNMEYHIGMVDAIKNI